MAAAKKSTKDDDEEPGFLKPRHAVDLFGQAKPEAVFAEAARSGRLHHAWLLSGPRGVGKATFAYRAARWLLAGMPEPEAGLFGDAEEGASPLHLDPENRVFRRVSSGGHADLMPVTRTINEKTGKMRGEIVISDTRRLGPFMHMTAAEGGWRIGIIDAADEMNPNAANSILKVVEEPPEKAVIFLVAHAPGRLLPTIRSRCRRLDFAPLAPEDLKAAVRARLPGVDEGALEAVLPLADGSAGRAVTLIEDDGIGHFESLRTLLATLPNLDVPALHGFADKLSRPAADNAFQTTRELYLWWLSRLIRQSAGGGKPDNQPGDPVIETLAPLMRPDRRHTVWETTSSLFEREGRVNLDRKQVILTALTGLQDALERR